MRVIKCSYEFVKMVLEFHVSLIPKCCRTATAFQIPGGVCTTAAGAAGWLNGMDEWSSAGVHCGSGPRDCESRTEPLPEKCLRG